MTSLQVFAGYSHRDLCGNAWGVDDAYISYRYAQNLMAGNGLVFNPGQQVEGYSNFLYVLLIAPAFLFTDGLMIYFYASLINVLAAAIASLVLYNYIRKKTPQYAFIAGLMFILYPPLWVWTASGMETAVVLLLQLGLIVATQTCVEDPYQRRHHLVAAGVIVLLVLTRSDGFIVPFIAILYLVLKEKYRSATQLGTVLGATLLGNFLWRYIYYRDLLPNTFYAKVSGPLLSRVSYSLQLILVLGVIAGLLPFLYLSIMRAGKEFKSISRGLNTLRNSISFESLFTIAWLTYWIFIGGDVYFERFLLILVPIGIIALVRLLQTYDSQRATRIVLILMLTMYAGIVLSDPRYSYSFRKYDCWKGLGEYLAEHHPGEVVATGAAGKIPYFSGLLIIDMYGLNDKYIAHQPANSFTVGHTKYAPEYVLVQKPDLITGWLVGNDLDAGMTGEKYTKAGYRLTYLVFMKPCLGPHEPIVAVSELDPEAIQALTRQGYVYAVLSNSGEP